MLVSAGHLETHPLVLVAGALWVEISTVSGTAALTLEENLNPVPGSASATNWTLYVPQVEPMAKLVRAAIKGHEHLSADEPAEPIKEAAHSGEVPATLHNDAQPAFRAARLQLAAQNAGSPQPSGGLVFDRRDWPSFQPALTGGPIRKRRSFRPFDRSCSD